jgi:hypothetical protein
MIFAYRSRTRRLSPHNTLLARELVADGLAILIFNVKDALA